MRNASMVEFKQSPSLEQEPHPNALIMKDIVGAKEISKSLLRFGTWILKHGMSAATSEHRVERALLAPQAARCFRAGWISRSCPTDLGTIGGARKTTRACD